MAMLGIEWRWASDHSAGASVCIRRLGDGVCDGGDRHVAVPLGPRWERPERVSVLWDGDVPVLHDREVERPSGCVVGAAAGSDLLAAIEFCAGGEEGVSGARDGRGRFRPEYSVLEDLGLTRIAGLDRYVARLRSRLTGSPESSPPAWPGGARFLVALTHDVDSLFDDAPSISRLRHLAVAGLRSRRRDAAALALVEGVRLVVPRRSRDGHRFNFDAWVALERAEAVRSTFHFFGDAGPRDVDDAWYGHAAAGAFAGRQITLRAVMRTLMDDGFDVGLHSSIASFHDEDAIRSDVEAITTATGRRPVSVRAHHLRTDQGHCRLMAGAGLGVDTSIGGMGFVRTLASPHPAYISADGPDLIEVPTVAMDHIFFKEARQGLPTEIATRRLDGVLQEVRRVGGVAAVLFHTDSFDAERKMGIYRWLITRIRELGGRCTTAAELVTAWEDRRRPIG